MKNNKNENTDSDDDDSSDNSSIIELEDISVDGMDEYSYLDERDLIDSQKQDIISHYDSKIQDEIKQEEKEVHSYVYEVYNNAMLEGIFEEYEVELNLANKIMNVLDTNKSTSTIDPKNRQFLINDLAYMNITTDNGYLYFDEYNYLKDTLTKFRLNEKTHKLKVYINNWIPIDKYINMKFKDIKNTVATDTYNELAKEQEVHYNKVINMMIDREQLFVL